MRRAALILTLALAVELLYDKNAQDPRGEVNLIAGERGQIESVIGPGLYTVRWCGGSLTRWREFVQDVHDPHVPRRLIYRRPDLDGLPRAALCGGERP